MLKWVCETAWPCYDICVKWDFLKFQSFVLPRIGSFSAIKVFYLNRTTNESFQGCFAKYRRAYHPKYSVTSTKTSTWQARNQEFFRAGEVSWNGGHFDKYFVYNTLKKDLRGKNSYVLNVSFEMQLYLLEAAKTAFQMKHLTHKCTQSASLNLTLFKARADCPAEKMFRQTRWISDRTSDKNLWLLKQFGANVFW